MALTYIKASGLDSSVASQLASTPKVTTITYPGTETATSTAGGETITLTGQGFASGVTVLVGTTAASVVTFTSSTSISFTAPALATGSYTLYVINTDGGTGISVPGLQYSGTPTWTTSAGSLGSQYETSTFNQTLVATGDVPITYSLSSGTLPPGSTLNANGTITGTSSVGSGSQTTYTFTVNAKDAQNQPTARTFTLTINPDVVTWVTPSSGATISLDGSVYSQALSATSAAGQTVTYTANTLPTGLTLSAGTISGTPTVEGNVTTLLTGTAANSTRTGTNTITWVISLADAYWKNLTLLLSADSTIQPTSFVADNSNNNTQLTIAGDTRATPFNPYQDGYYSVAFAGAETVVIPYSASVNFGSGNFTMEGWFYFTSVSNNPQVVSAYTTTNNYAWYMASAGNLGYYLSSNGSTWDIASNVSMGATLSSNVWYHIALVRNGTTFTPYINGVAGTTTTSSAAIAQNSTPVSLGGYSTYLMSGYISNFRIVKGTAVYTSTFTPSTTPLAVTTSTSALVCRSNRFIDNAKAAAITVTGSPKISSAHPFTTVYQAGTQNYSVYFDGTGDKLGYASFPAIGTGDVTVECWVYTTSIATNADCVFTVGDGASPYWNIAITTNTGGQRWDLNVAGAGSTPLLTSSAAFTTYPALNTWVHHAVSRASGTVRWFINGTQVYSASGAGDLNLTGVMLGWSTNASPNYFTGYISNFRVVRGTAVYTSAFTPSTTPLTAISGTSLLTCQSSTLIDNSTNAYALTASGDVKPVAISPFASSSYTGTQLTTLGGGYFDGTGDYVDVPSSSTFGYGTGDFTIEFWAYFTSISASTPNILDQRAATNPQVAPTFYLSNGVLSYYVSGANRWTGSTLVANRWYHLAICRSSSSTRFFVNGVQDGATYADTNNYINSPVRIFGSNDGSTLVTQAGYCSDLRIVKGTALYTSNFVPQYTGLLSNVANTQLLTLQYKGNHNNSAFIENSNFNNIVTRSGNVSNSAISPYGDNWSWYFNGSTDYITIANTSLLELGANSNDFTIEAWVNLNVMPTATSTTNWTGDWSSWMVVFERSNGGSDGWQFRLGQTSIALGGMSDNTIIYGTHGMVVGTWYHIACTRTSSTYRLFVNGVMKASGAGSSTMGTGGSFYIGSEDVSGARLNGYISNLRVVAGTSLYAADTTFTPPTSPLSNVANTSLLACKTNRFIDNSPNSLALTVSGTGSPQKFSPFSSYAVSNYYSNYFDGTGDYLTVPYSSQLAEWYNTDYTLEAWVYTANWSVSVNNSAPIVISHGIANNTTLYWSFGWNSTGYLGFYYYNGSASNLTSATIVSKNTWHHIAMTHTNATGAISLYLDGVSVASGTKSGTPQSNSGSTIQIGHAQSTSFSGYISNMRVVKGQVLYTTTFTPSTTPLTTTSQGATASNVSLLTCQTNTIVDNSPNYITITVAGDTKPSQVSPFTPAISSSPVSYSPTTFGGSMYLDGTGDNVYTNTINKFGYGDHTIELWVWFGQVSSRACIITQGWGTTGYDTTGGWTLDIAGSTSNTISLALASSPGGSGAFWLSSMGSFSINQWYHLAMVRNGTSVKVYSNGVQIGSGSLAAATTVMTNMGVLRVGSYDNSTFYFTGYISDLRVSSGALYKSNFYPPALPLTPNTTVGTTTYTSALLLSGTNGGITDVSRTLELESVGDVKVAQFSPYNGNYYSNYFDGTGDSLYLAGATSAVNYGTSDFTIELWFYAMDTTWRTLWDQRNGNTTLPSIQWCGVTANKVCLYINSAFQLNSTNTFNTGMWHHVALVRQSGVITLYVNGMNNGTYNYSISITGAATYIGDYSAGGYSFYGYISNVRVVNGTAVYTSAFTPPTSPLTAIANTTLLTCQSKQFVDNSTNGLAITRNGDVKVQTQNPFQLNTGISYYFDGSGDYLTVPANKYPAISGAFTFDCWVYTSTPCHTFFGTWNNGTDQWSIAVNFSATGWSGYGLYFYYGNYGSNESGIGTSAAGKLNAWNHIAVTRDSSNTWYFFINGVSQTTTTTGTWTANRVFSNTSTLYLGSYPAGTQYYTGYVTDLRMTLGSARYTSSFTPPSMSVKTK